jgi:hypothetical protein
MAVRAPQLHRSLHCFCLGAFRLLAEEDADLPFAFEGHESRGRPTLYEYRPLVRDFVESRARKLEHRQDAQLAVQDLRAEPAAALFGEDPFKSVLLPLLLRVAETCGGFDWDDAAFERCYADLEHSLFGESRTYAAVAPLVGLTTGIQRELGPGIRVRAAVDDELSRHWPEARGLLPQGFGHEADRYCVLELRSALGPDEEPPDAPAEIADAVSAIRLATAAPLAAGPVLFETLDGRPYGIRPVLPIAATQPPGEPTRLDEFRAALATELLVRLVLADSDTTLAEALDRWELSLFQHEPFRSEQLRGALSALFGATWALRVAVLLEAEADRRASLHGRLEALCEGAEADVSAREAVRRALVEVLREDDRRALTTRLDRTLLGLEQPGGLRAAS